MPTYTGNYNIPKPNVNSADDEDLWGEQLNDGIDIIDTVLKENADAIERPSGSAITGDYTLVPADLNRVILIDATAGNITIDGDATTLGDGFRCMFLRIDNVPANTVTFDPAGAQTINGATTKAIAGQYTRLGIISDGTNFYITEENYGFASAAETLAGSLTDKALTPAGFAGNKTLAANGFYKLPGGLIIQWGVCTEGTNTFPTPFTSAATYAVVITKTPAGSEDAATTVTRTSGSQFLFQKANIESEQGLYIAIGY